MNHDLFELNKAADQFLQVSQPDSRQLLSNQIKKIDDKIETWEKQMLRKSPKHVRELDSSVDKDLLNSMKAKLKLLEKYNEHEEKQNKKKSQSSNSYLNKLKKSYIT